MSIRESIYSYGKQTLKQSNLIQRLNEPMSTHLIRRLSNPFDSINHHQTKVFRVKKLQSAESSSTNEDIQGKQEMKFMAYYKNDLIFRKRVDLLVRQYEKKQKKNSKLQVPNTQSHQTWRIQKEADEKKVLMSYEKCKKWINKANQTR